MSTKSFKDLIVWQKSKELAIAVYQLTADFPKEETYGLISQMRRAAISISSNIAESYNRFHKNEKRQFLFVAYGSGSELESQLEIAKTLFSDKDYKKVEIILEEVMKILNNILNSKY